MSVPPLEDRWSRLEARLAKATWTNRALTVWCLLLTWHGLDTRSMHRLFHDRNQPLLTGSVLLIIALAGLWSHGVLWARPREPVRFD